MADGTKIEWCDSTWNPVRGCTRLSPGCGGPNHEGGCYAEKIAARFSDPGQPFHGYAERTKHGGRWTGKLALVEDMIDVPLRWRKPRRIFVNSMSDLFHENLPDEAIDRVFAVMALAPQHTFLVLTKRAERMRAWFEERWQGTPAQRIVFSIRDILDVPAGGETGRRHQVEEALGDFLDDYEGGKFVDTDNDALWDENGSLKARHFNWPLPNVWLGVSVEDQARADERIPHLLATPAAKRFISAEPLLGPVDASRYLYGGHRCIITGYPGDHPYACGDCDPCLNTFGYKKPPHLNWVIAGGESGPGARPFNIAWAEALVTQCRVAGVACFVKQLGARPYWQEVPLLLKDKKGGDWSEWHAELRVREFPA